tara:strand:- start:545 stop:799 length:255 start_codon:yes stop_codon:yes gene_type:complete
VVLVVTEFKMIGEQALTSIMAVGAVVHAGAVLLILLVVKVAAEGLAFLGTMLEPQEQPTPEVAGVAHMVQVESIGPEHLVALEL